MRAHIYPVSYVPDFKLTARFLLPPTSACFSRHPLNSDFPFYDFLHGAKQDTTFTYMPQMIAYRTYTTYLRILSLLITPATHGAI